MKEQPSKEETQLRSAEEILKERLKNIHFIRSDETYALVLDAMELYASQFKPSGVKTFTLEDMKAAFDAGRDHEYAQHFCTFSRFQKSKFGEWIKTRK